MLKKIRTAARGDDLADTLLAKREEARLETAAMRLSEGEGEGRAVVLETVYTEERYKPCPWCGGRKTIRAGYDCGPCLGRGYIANQK